MGVSATVIGASALLPATPRLLVWAGLGVAWIVGIALAARRLSVAERDATTIVTGMLALSMGFGFWWIYFDLVGSRLPRANRVALANWVMSHLPVTLAITAAGAGMVSLIGHAHDTSAPASTSWLLAGAVATGPGGPGPHRAGAGDDERLSVVFHPLRLALGAGAAAALLVGWLRPAPWLLALGLVAILSGVWFFAVSRFLRADAWGEP